MDSIDEALIETRKKLREARIANDKLRGSLAILGDQYKMLERENGRLLEYVQALEEQCDSEQLARAQFRLPNVESET